MPNYCRLKQKFSKTCLKRYIPFFMLKRTDLIAAEKKHVINTLNSGRKAY